MSKYDGTNGTKEVFGEDVRNCKTNAHKDILIPVKTIKEEHNGDHQIFECVYVKEEPEDVPEINNEATNMLCQETRTINVAKLDCDICKETYDLFCHKCSMLSRVLNNMAPHTKFTARKTLPKHLLKIKSSRINGHGVISLVNLPKSLIFGPYEGLVSLEISGGSNIYKLQEGKLIENDGAEGTTWLRYIKRVYSEKANLNAFQSKGCLFYRSNQRINKNEELLVYYDEELVKGSSNNKEICYEPVVEENLGQMYACGTCCLGFSEKMYLSRHLIGCTKRLSRKSKEVLPALPPPPFQKRRHACPKCGYGTNVEAELRQHALTHGDVKPFLCPTCGKGFTRSRDLKTHNVTHTGERSFACNACGRRFTLKTSLRRHQRIHSGEKPFACDLCDYRSSYRENMVTHVKRAHPAAAEDGMRHQCPRCDYQTERRRDFERHLNVHDGIKPHKCLQCEKSFTKRAHLAVHHLMHTGEKRLSCDLCDYKCNYRRCLRVHMLDRHGPAGGGKLFECVTCSYGTNDKSTYDRHALSHDGAKPFQCDVCGKHFTLRSSLKNHHLIVHRHKKLFECRLCSYGCNDKRNLTSHLKKKHQT